MIGNVKLDCLAKTQNVLTSVFMWNVIQDLTVPMELAFQICQFQQPQFSALHFLIYVLMSFVSPHQDVLLAFVFQSKFCLLQFDYLFCSKFYFIQKVFKILKNWINFNKLYFKLWHINYEIYSYKMWVEMYIIDFFSFFLQLSIFIEYSKNGFIFLDLLWFLQFFSYDL